MKDIIENFEDCAEREYDNMLQPDGKLKCFCGNIFDPENEGEVLSSNPWAMPVCNECCKKFFEHMEKK